MLEVFIHWLNQYKSAVKIQVLDNEHAERFYLHYDFEQKVFVDEEGRAVLSHSELNDDLKADGLSIETVSYDEGLALDLNGLVGSYSKLWERTPKQQVKEIDLIERLKKAQEDYQKATKGLLNLVSQLNQK